MTERLFLCNFVFKPIDPKLKLRPEEIQLLLSYIGEILKEIDADEKLIIEEEKSMLQSNKGIKNDDR